jgi:serine phosphatase RsbU (regulator of sigma subunit)
LFGSERVRQLCGEGGTAQQVTDRVIRAVQTHFGTGSAEDDICMVVIERLPATEPPMAAGKANG